MKIANCLLILTSIIFTNILPSDHQLTKFILPPTPFGPAYIQAHNPELEKWREEMDHGITQELLDANKNIECVGLMRQDASKVYRCFQFAVEMITGYNGYIEFPEDGSLSIDLAKYLQQTPYPQKMNFLIYTTSETDRTIQHFAVALDRINSIGKSGSYPYITKGGIFNIMKAYGKTVWSFELKPEYQGIEGKKYLLEEMRIDITKALSKKNQQYFQKLQLLEDQLTLQRNQRFPMFGLGFMAGVAYVVLLMYYKHSKQLT